MPNLNTVVLCGHATRDPEITFLPSNTPVVEFTIAVNRYWKNQNGEKQEEVAFIGCKCFGKLAEIIADRVRKGDPVLVSGRLSQDSWEDKQTGQKRSKTYVFVSDAQFLVKRESSGGDYGGDRKQERPASAQDRGRNDNGMPPVEEDDIPF